MILLLALLILAYPLLQGVGKFLIVSDSLEKADLITAVSGPSYRITYAAELFQEHLGSYLFFTGGFNEHEQRYGADWSETLARNIGVPPENIYTDDSTVISTYQEAERVKAFIEAHPEQIHSVIVVTDAYHTRRAKWAYEKALGPDIKVMVTAVPFDEAGYSSKWWRSAITREMVVKEYLKYTFYLFRYQWTSGAIQDFLAKFDKF
ncbi:MAG: YdcF family protein [Anaerolineaceae bacterium]|nr:YdcF family protein [Anaerolineaceae bacterium]